MDRSEERASASETASTSGSHRTLSSTSLPPSSSPAPSLLPSCSSLVCYSPRVQNMIDNRSRFSSETELNIAYSREHWSELSDSSTDWATTRLGNRAHFQKLKEHPEWGGFFKDVKVELGEKINEGGQAEIYDAKVEFEDGRKFGHGYFVVKVMKGDSPLEDFQRQWPVGMLRGAVKDIMKGPLMWIKCGTMVDDRFAFVMVRQWGDLRTLMDMKMRLNNNQGPPFADFEFVRKVLLCIARDMDKLHTKYKIVHRDLKASNVLLWSLGEELPDANPLVKANVVDYECSVGVVGTGFWRAPEILEQLKKGTPSSELVFTFESDVYSYGMVCYELLTGHTPFEGHYSLDVVIDGGRPELPAVPGESRYLVKCVEMCWSEMPWERPSFSEIVKIMEASASSFSKYARRNGLISIRNHFSGGTATASALRLQKWGDLRKLIDMKMRLNNNRGPPFTDFEFVRKVMLCVASDMDLLHTKFGIIHRELKASNVILWSSGEQLPDANPHVRANVVDYKCWEEPVGTGFWRAPEILKELKEGTLRSEMVFTYKSDVYSYAMLCYELLTGRTPFEGHSSLDYDVGLSGDRPELPHVPWESRLLVGCVERCWSEMPWERPNFSEIVTMLESWSSSSSSSSSVYSSRVQSRFPNWSRFISGIPTALGATMRKWGDLRNLIDMKMRLNINQDPPFADLDFVRKVMLCIARDMHTLNTKHNIVHRDLKASNVLLWSFGEHLPDAKLHVKADVVGYECLAGVVGTGFWRAPETLEQIKRRVPISKVVFRYGSDVYSYGMLYYELLTGRTPFVGHPAWDYDVGLSGNRPELPQVPWDTRLLVEMCWSDVHWERPTFSDIVQILEAFAPLSSVSYSPRVQSMIDDWCRFNSFSSEETAPGVRGRKWGNLRKLIDMKKLLSQNEGPPFAESFEFVGKVMLCIARHMKLLQRKCKSSFRDLKASNVILWSFGDQRPDANPHVKATLEAFTVNTMGTGFWRAPEILEQLKKGVRSSKLVFTSECDVYSYGMLSYELLTGRTPFEGQSSEDYDVGLGGNRPELPEVPQEFRLLVECVEMCWSEIPRKRPPFSEIVKLLGASFSP